MPGIRSITRGGPCAVVALAFLGLAAGGAVAEQRQATLLVTVEVVDACSAATGTSGLEAQGCESGATPVAVIRESAAGGPAGDDPSAPVARVAEPSGYVTVVY